MKWTLIFLPLLLIACSRGQKVPRGILPPEKMQTLVWDLMRADEMVNYYKIRDSSFNKLDRVKKVYDTVLLVHRLSTEDLKKNISFYESRPDLMKPILDSLQKKSDKPSLAAPVSLE